MYRPPPPVRLIHRAPAGCRAGVLTPWRAMIVTTCLLICSAAPPRQDQQNAPGGTTTRPAEGTATRPMDRLRRPARPRPSTRERTAPPVPQSAGIGSSSPTVESDDDVEELRRRAMASTLPAAPPNGRAQVASETPVPPTTAAAEIAATEAPRTSPRSGETVSAALEAAAAPVVVATAPAEPPAAPVAAAPEPLTATRPDAPYLFNYYETPWKDVLDDFSRISGLTLVGDYKSLTDTLTYRCPRPFTYAEWLYEVNELLLARPTGKFLIQARENYLWIARLADAVRNIEPRFMFNAAAEFEAARLPDHEMCLVIYRPPAGWPPVEIIEQFRPRFEDYYGTQVWGEDVMLTGMARDHRRFVEVVGQFTRLHPTPPSSEQQWKTILLRNARAGEVQNLLQRLYPPMPPTPPRPGADPEALAAKQISIVADLPNNAILVRASPAKTAEISQLIREMDDRPRPPDAASRVFELKHLNADEMANVLRPISQAEQTQVRSNTAGPFLSNEEIESRSWSVYPQPGGMTLLAVGGEKGLARVAELIAAFDLPDPHLERARIVLKFAAPAEISQVLQQLFRPARGQPTVTFAPDASGSAVIVVGRPDQVAQVREAIAEMDRLTPVTEHEHLIKLERAAPTDVAGAMTQLVAGVPTPGKRGLPGTGQPRFIGNDMSGMLLVRCEDEDWPRFEALIRELDGQASDAAPVLRTYALKHADADEVAAILTPLFTGQVLRRNQPPVNVKLTPDARDNTIRAWASPEMHERLGPMIAELDIASDIGRVQTIKLAHADANEVAAVLTQTFGAPPRPGPAGGAPSAAIRITAEPLTNSLLVVANRVVLEQIRTLAAEMDANAEQRQPLRLTVEVHHRPVAEVAETLRALTPRAAPAKPGQPSLDSGLKIVQSGDQIVLDGPRDKVMEVFALIPRIDVPGAGRKVKIYPVTDAEEAAKALQALLFGLPSAGRPVTGGGPGAQAAARPSAAPATSIQIYPDTYRNVLIVHADPLDLPHVDALVDALEKDIEPPPGEERTAMGDWHSFMLKHRKADDLTYDLEDILAPRGTKNPPEFRVGPDEMMLLVRCKPRQLPDVEHMVKMFDVPDSKDYGKPMQLVTLDESISATHAAQLIAAQFRSETGRSAFVDTSAAGAEIEVIDIHADDAPPATQPAERRLPPAGPQGAAWPSRRPLFSAPPAAAFVVAAAFGMVDPPTTGAGREEPAPDSAEGRPPAPRKSLRVSVLPDGRLMITGEPEDVALAKQLFEDNVRDQPVNMELKIFPIKFADVTQLALTLEAIFNERAVPQPGQPQQPQQPQQAGQPGAAPGQPGQPAKGAPVGPTSPLITGRDRRGPSRAAAAAGAGRIRVVAEPRTRQLFVRAVPTDFPLVIAVLKTLDVETTTARNVRMFPLKNLEAVATAQALRDVLGLEQRLVGPMAAMQQGGRRFQMPGQPGQPGQEGQPPQGQPGQPPGQPGQPGQQPGQPGGVVATADQTTITAEEQTNTIIASGSPDTLKLIERLINEMESMPNTAQPTMKRVPLQFARATEIVTVVRDIVQRAGGAAAGGQPFGGGRRSVRAGSQVSINADTRTNSVVLAGASDDVTRAEKIIADLDIDTGDSGQVEIVTVKGDVQTMSAALREMYARGGPAGAGADIAITADVATGTLLIRAPSTTRAEIIAKAREMEQTTVAASTPRTIKLALADADAVARKLMDIFSERGVRAGKQQVKITGVSSIKSLVVQAPDDLYPEIEKHARAMDAQPVELDIRSFKLKHAKAAEVVDKIRDLVTQIAASMSRSGGAGSDINLGMFAYTADPLTNSIVVTGNPITFVVMQKVLDAVDVEPSTLTRREVRSYVLNPNVNAVQIAANIAQLFAGLSTGKDGIPQPSVTAEPNSNIVLVTATEPQHKEIKEKIIDPVLQQVAQEPKQHRVKLEHARADEAATVLNNHFNQWRANRGNKPQDAISIVPDLNANTLLVTANESMKALFDEMLKTVDVEPSGESQQVTKTYQVKYADPNAVVGAVNNAFQPAPGRQPRPSDIVRAAADWATGSIVIRASAEKHAEIDKLIEAMDRETETARSSRILEVVNSDPRDVATALQNIYNQKQRTRTGIPPVTISALQGSTKIVVNCNDDEFAEIKQLVEQIDQGGDRYGGRTAHTVTMPDQIRARTVAESINNLYGGQAYGGPGQGLKAVSNDPTNTLIVFATEREFEKIHAEVIDKLKAVPPVGVLNIYRVPLTYASADEVARTLSQFFREMQGLQQQAAPWWFEGGRGGGGEKALEDRVTITAEAGSNTLIIACTESTKKKIDEILKDIDTDTLPGGNNVLEMFALRHIDCNEMIAILEEYLRLARRTPTEDPQASIPWWARGPAQKQDEKVVLAGDMRLKAVDSQNAIIVVGKSDSMPTVRDLIAKLDVPIENSATAPRLIALRHANASQLASTLSRAFAESTTAAPTGRSSARPIKPVIVAESATNSLIIRASAPDFALIEKMVSDLDQGMQADAADVRLVLVPGGYDVVHLARTIETTLNSSEDNRGRMISDYKPDRVSIQGDVRSGALLVAGSKAKYEMVSQLVEQLTQLQPGSKPGVTFIRTKNARPEDIKKLIDDMQQKQRGGGAGGARSDGGRPRARSAPAIAAALMLSAAFAQAAPPATQEASDGPVVQRVRPLVTPPVPAPAATTQPRPTGGPDVVTAQLSGAPLTIQSGPSGLIVIGTEEDRRIIESLVTLLDQEIPQALIEYVELKNAKAVDLARSMQDVYTKLEQQRPQGVQPRPEDKVAFIAEPRTNGIFVAATEVKMPEVLELVRKSDLTPAIAANALRTFVLKNRRVRDVEPNLKNVIQMWLRQRGITDTNQIAISTDEQTNTLFVTGGEKDLEEIGKVIDQLDSPPPSDDEATTVSFGRADIMIVPLRVATADKLAQALTKLIQDASTGKTPTNDFIRRLRVLDEDGEPIAELNMDGPTFVVGDPESNSLVCASTRKNLLILREIIKRFDVEPLRDAIDLKVRVLKYADATEVAERFNGLLREAKNLTKRPGKGETVGGVPESAAGSLVYEGVVTPDARTNTVILAGKPEAITLFEGILDKLDVPGQSVMPIEIIKLQYGSAANLETVLDDLMKKRTDALPKGTGPNAGKSETVIIKADPRAESLIVAARPDRMLELRDLVAKLDIPATALIDNIRTITLKNGNAADLSKKIDELWTKRSEQRQGADLKLEKPAIVADERSNSLVVVAAKGDYDAIKALVDKLEALPFGPVADIRLIQLKWNSAKDLAPLFKKLFDERAKQREGADGKTRPTDMVSIDADPVTNTLLVACSPENFELLRQKVNELDVEMGAPGIVELFLLKNVEAARVKKTIDEIFEKGVFKPGGGAAESAVAKAREKVTVATDDRSNTLIVSASPENIGIIRQLVQRMEDVQTPWNLSNTRIFGLQYADAVKLAAQVQDYFKKLDDAAVAGERKRTDVPITIIADERTNRVLVGASPDGLARAEILIKELDVPGDPTSSIEIYRLRDGSAAKIGPMLETLFKDRNQPRGGAAAGASVPSVAVTVKVDETSNALVISASREDHTLMRALVEMLDRRSNILDQVRLFALQKARAESIKKILEELYKGSTGTTGGTGTGPAMAVAVTTDPRTNSVVVAGPPGELENIARLVERIDSAMPIDEAQISIFPLENADAKKTSDLLNELLKGNLRPGGAGGGASASDAAEMGSMLISFAAQDPRGQEMFFKTIRENVQVSYDDRTNSVIVVAPPPTVVLVGNLVKTLDSYKKRDVYVRVFMLRNADAAKTVELLEKIFAQDAQSEQQREFQQGREIRVAGGATSGEGGPSAVSQGGVAGSKGTFGKPKTTFTSDSRTNSVIVAGWQEDIDVAGDIIDQLDSQDIQDRVNFVYPLQNAKAEDVVTALDSYFQKETERLGRQGQGLSEARKAEQEVSAVSHKESNQVILSFSPRYQSSVMNIVRQLDTPPPQVMIQVLLAEVTLDDRFEMGLEFALQQLRFSETAVTGPNGTLSSNHFDVVGGTDLGAAASSGGLGGFSFTVTGEDFNFLVRSLQADSKLEVLQRPMIMCQDNQEASINVGQSVPFVRGTQVTDNGQVTSQIEYDDIGIKLEVKPHINPDGFVYLEVMPEISAITPSTIDVGNGIRAPIFTKRDASTTVVVKDGETVVIGGLITTSDQETESKVPILGDIPGLGVLFRTTQRSKTKTELLIVLTPRVVRTVEDARRLSIEARDVTSVLTPDQKQSPLMAGLRVTPESESEVLEPQDLSVPRPAPLEELETEPVEPAGPAYGPAAPVYGPLAPVSDAAAAPRTPSLIYGPAGDSQ